MIPEVNPYNNYRGDGVATLFDYDFFIQNGSQLIVEHIDENDVVTRLEENIDYEIVVIDEEFAGYIKFPIEDSKFGILQENETLSLQLTLPFEQISEYGQSSLLDLNSIEFSYDYLTRLCQILKRQMERAVKVNEGSEANPTELLETINNNAIVTTNAAALASQKADEALESANVASSKIEELQSIYDNAKEDIEQSSAENIEELNKIKQEAQNFKEELIEGGMFKFQLFDPKTTDRILSYEESFGWALQGTYVYSTAIAGERYGYPDFIERCKKEKSEATATSVTLGSNTLTIYIHSSGHQYYDIADKSKVDAFYNTYGVADYYGIDEENNSVFLPRNKWFIQLTDSTANVNKFTDAGLPDITGTATHLNYDSVGVTTGAFGYEGSTYAGPAASGNTDNSRLTFKASRSSSVYGNSSTVQTRSSMKLLYYCVGNTKADTSWVDVVTQVEGGVKDLEDKTNEGLNELNSATSTNIAEINAVGDSYENVTHRNITNCWTKIPQRIKYTLVNGTLTILAGSVVIFPYGTEDLTEQLPIGSSFLHDNLKVVDTYWDGSKFFVWAELVNDRDSYYTTARTNRFFFVNSLGGTTHSCLHSSGATDTSAGTTWRFWYDTANNYVKKFETDGTTPVSQYCSLPILSFDSDTTGYTKINHTFNGWGYIGGVRWIEELEGLASDGYNDDGTYKNVVIKTAKLSLNNSLVDTNTRDWFIGKNTQFLAMSSRCFKQEEDPNITSSTSNNWYNPKTNKSYYFNGTYWEERVGLKLLTNTADGTNITGVTDTPQTFRPLDIKDKKLIQGWSISAVLPDYTKGINCATLPYTAPANGWIIGYANQTTTTTLYIYIEGCEVGREGDGYADVQCPIAKGEVLSASSTPSGDRNHLFFYPMKGNS